MNLDAGLRRARRAVSPLPPWIPAAVAAACLGGCGYDGRSAPGLRRHFPIGMFAVGRAKDVAELRRAGFTVVQSLYRDAALTAPIAAEARRLGMDLLAHPDDAMKSPVSATRRWPMLAWYIFDEPEVSRLTGARLGEISRQVRAWDPARPQAFVVGLGAAASSYSQVADVLMLDWYPVPHLPLDSVADQLDDARRFWPQDKPVWMVLQGFDWRDSVQRDPKKPRIGRFPDHAEIRFMSYLSILHGANGIFFWQWGKPGGRVLSDVPEDWQAVARVAREISAMRPIFERGRRISLPWTGGAPEGVEAAAWRLRGRDYVIVANRSRRASPLPAELLGLRWRPLFEPRRDVREILERQGESWALAPLSVVALESRSALGDALARLMPRPFDASSPDMFR